MSENTINAALRSLGYTKETMTGHGFRAMARTILDEVLNERVDLIEHQLAHAVKDPNGRAYNRTAHLLARHKMMQRLGGLSGRPSRAHHEHPSCLKEGTILNQDELIKRLDAVLSRLEKPIVPIESQLWDHGEVSAYRRRRAA